MSITKSKVKTAILRSYVNENASNEEKMSTLGSNTGNLVFWESIDRLFKPDIVSYSDSERLKDYDNVIITDLIWIRENSNYDYLEKLVDTYNIPFIPISVGLQSPNFNPNFKLSDNLVRLLKKLEKRATLGVRGYYTAEILTKYGITNFSVIGCPSMYYWNNPNLKISESQAPKTFSSNFKTFYSPLTRIEKHFLSYCADKNMQFVEQTKHKLTLEQTKDPKYFEYVNGWLEKNTVIYYDYDSWCNGLKGIDFSMGGRFHGNVIALQNNIKALFLTSDSRTEEMTDLFQLPVLHMSKFDKKKPIEYYFKLADYSKFNAKYPLLYKNFVEFVNKNGLVFDKNATPIEFKPKKENKSELKFDIIKSLEPIDYQQNNMISIKLIKTKNRITYSLNVNRNLEKYFFLDKEFFVEFEHNIEDCPDSVAIIPALSVILPISWVENATVIVDDIDEDYYESIEDVKENYAFMMPNILFSGKIIVKKITKNNINQINHKVLCLYSGGVDATFTMIHNINYKPTLMTIWGTDIFLKDINAWNLVKNKNEQTAKSFNLPFATLTSSFREILNESLLTQKYGELIKDNWWHAFEHGLALLGLVAPYAYLNNFSDIKIASSYSSKDYEKHVCASLPQIDENVKYFGATIYHDGFYKTRNDKIKSIINYHKKNNINFNLRVCWQQISDKNCCVCEKCVRTILSILSYGENPKNFGFELTAEKENTIIDYIKRKKILINYFWQESIDLIINNKENIPKTVLTDFIINNYNKK